MKTQQILKPVVIGMSAIVGIGALIKLTSTPFTLKTGWLPIGTLLVASSALVYAISTEEIRVIPKVG